VLALQDLRRRTPVVVFILLTVVCLVLLGIACACASDHPKQKIDRALSAIPAAPPLVEVWTFSLGALIILVSIDLCRRRATETSAALLQRFLF
jgi:hypothetical protein